MLSFKIIKNGVGGLPEVVDIIANCRILRDT